jgi:hypothetical protein
MRRSWSSRSRSAPGSRSTFSRSARRTTERIVCAGER